ncbi:MAG: Hpt domain-containing protein [Acholeplasmatales bacterium]|nr:Hpt domain-containing protein [Acholeplasmatales bacterium]
MDVKDIYSKINGDYNKVLDIFKSDALIERFLKKFILSNELNLLYSSIKDKNHDEAYRYAHTFKGMAMSLYLTDLINVSQELVDLYKSKNIKDKKINSLYNELESRFNKLKALLN